VSPQPAVIDRHCPGSTFIASLMLTQHSITTALCWLAYFSAILQIDTAASRVYIPGLGLVIQHAFPTHSRPFPSSLIIHTRPLSVSTCTHETGSFSLDLSCLPYSQVRLQRLLPAPTTGSACSCCLSDSVPSWSLSAFQWGLVQFHRSASLFRTLGGRSLICAVQHWRYSARAQPSAWQPDVPSTLLRIHFRIQRSLTLRTQGVTATGGPNWIDAVTTMYNKSLVFTYNFAVAGATVNKSMVGVCCGSDLIDQVNSFTSWNSKAVRPWKATGAGKSLFSIFVRPLSSQS
jgi:hypothetical protein